MPSSSENSSATTARPAQFLRQAAPCLLLAGLLGIPAFIYINFYIKKDSKHPLLPSAVYYHRVKKGMPQEAVEHSCGRPEYVEQMNAPGDEAEAWFYSASDGQIQIDFDNGKVHKIHRD